MVGSLSYSVTDDALDRLVADIDATGVGCLTQMVEATELAQLQDYVADLIQKNGGQSISLEGNASFAGSCMASFVNSADLQALLYRVYERGYGKVAPPIGLYPVLRCLSGASGKKHSMIFHYDSFVLTALAPIRIPTSGSTGDLLMLPNTRKLRQTYFFNLVDKFLLDNALTQRFLALIARHGLIKFTRLKLQPGNIYFFWGYRSVHTNEPCSPENIRATAIIHYLNPHQDSKLNEGLRKMLGRKKQPAGRDLVQAQ